VREDGLGFPEHGETVERLERGVAPVKPPDDLFDRILAETRPAPVIALRERLGRSASPVAAAAVAAVAAVLVTLNVTGGDGLGDPVRRAALTGGDVRGSAALYRPDDRDGVLVLDLDRIPQPPPAHYYEIWVSRPNGRKLPIGTFTPDDGSVHLELRLPGPGRYLSIDISVEEEDGPPEHSGRSIATARLL
jgi:hypothetical protein